MKYGDTFLSVIPSLWMDAHFEGRTKGQWNVYISKKGVNGILGVLHTLNKYYGKPQVEMFMSALSEVASPNVLFTIGVMDMASLVIEKLPSQYLNKEGKFIKKEITRQAESNNDYVYILRRVEYYGYQAPAWYNGYKKTSCSQ